MNSATIDYLIVGNSTAAVAAVEAVRAVDAQGRLTVVSRERHHTYSRPLISYLLAGQIEADRLYYRPADFYERNAAEALLGVEALGVDPVAQTVRLADKRELRYGKLLIATGGQPIVPPVEGRRTDGVFTFTTWDDAALIEQFIISHRVKRAVVVGGGLIGLKAVEALMARDIQCTVVELADRILSTGLDARGSRMAEDALERGGAHVRCHTTVETVAGERGLVCGVVLHRGESIPCELAVFAIGVRPNTAVVAGTAVKVDRGILVDDQMCTSVDTIFAAGDVAQASDLLQGGTRPLPIFPNAFRQGTVAGLSMAGTCARYDGGLAMNSVDVCGLPVITVGLTCPPDDRYEELATATEDPPTYRKVVLKHDRIVGGVFIGDIDRAGIITGLIRRGVKATAFKDMLLSDEFGLINLPADYRKHMVSGAGIEI